MEDIDFLLNEDKYSFSPELFDTEDVLSDLLQDSEQRPLFYDHDGEMEVEMDSHTVVDNDVFSDSDSVASEIFDTIPIHNNIDDSFNETETCSEPFNFESIDVEKDIGPFTESERNVVDLLRKVNERIKELKKKEEQEDTSQPQSKRLRS